MSYSKLQEEVLREYKHLRPFKLDADTIIQNYYSVAIPKGKKCICYACRQEIGESDKLFKKADSKAIFDPHRNPKRKIRCPHCHREIVRMEGHHYKHYQAYYATYHKHKEWQVIRMHFISMNEGRKVSEAPTFQIDDDNFQIWINPNGQRVTIGYTTNVYPSRHVNPLTRWSDYKIKSNYATYSNASIDEEKIYSMHNWFKEAVPSNMRKSTEDITTMTDLMHKRQNNNLYNTLIENGHIDLATEININDIRKYRGQITEYVLNKNLNYINWSTLKNVIDKCKAHPYFETLLKMDRIKLANEISLNEMVKYTDQIRIAIFKRNYQFSYWFTWRDTINMLEEEGKDIHSPKYICPTNLEDLHAKLIERANRRRRIENAKENMKKAIKDTKAFNARMSKYFDLLFKDKNITIVPLKSPAEYIEEGIAMNHCVGTYYNHADCLILSAKNKAGKRLATIEVSTKTFQIVQIQAHNDRVSPYADEITKLINKNMTKIKKAKLKKSA